MQDIKDLKLTVPETDLPRIVIIGGGFGGLNLAKKLKGVAAQVVLLDRNNFHTFQPLLYQVATAGLEPDSIAGPLRKSLEGQSNFVFRMVKVTSLDFECNCVQTEIGSISYDFLVLANGSVTNYFGKDNLRDQVLPLKRVLHALNLRSHILQNFERAELVGDEETLRSMMNVVVVGGGPTGVEVAGSLAELRNYILPKDHPDLDFNKMEIYLMEGSDRLLGGMSEKSGKDAAEYLEKMGVIVNFNSMVDNYENNRVYLDDKVINSHTVIWAAGVKGKILPGLTADHIMKDRVSVDRYNRVSNLTNVFAIGDVARMESKKYPAGHPMLAPVAIQQGRHLAKNFAALLEEKQMTKFKYLDKGAMATIGRNKAVVDMPGGIHLKGFIAWLIWMFIHIMYLIGFRNRLITLNNWIWSYFTYDKGTRLILRKFSLPPPKSPVRGSKVLQELET
ncbi:MAG: NAD(P)/FAD-dependent oxidoreductase [Bacteroidota bacterium]